MKRVGFTLMLFVVVLSPLAAVCQRPPDGSSLGPAATESAAPAGVQTKRAPSNAPAITPPDEQWRKIQKLPRGVAIVVGNTYGPEVGCRFAGATEDSLYCDAPESPDGQGWVFERASVISVEATVLRKNHHPGWIASMIAGGTIVGLVATRGTSAGNAARIGAIGALVTGGIGVPLAMATPDSQWVTVVYRPRVARERRLRSDCDEGDSSACIGPGTPNAQASGHPQ